MNITTAELLDALHTASAAPKDAKTLNELCEAYGLKPAQMRISLRTLQSQGRLQNHQVTRTYLDGRAGKVPAYTILPKARKK